MVLASKIVLWVSMLLTIFVVLQFKDVESFKPFPTTVHVSITNNFTNSLQVDVHCKDNHDDFGNKTLKYKEVYSFSFKTTFLLPNKLYFCSVSWI